MRKERGQTIRDSVGVPPDDGAEVGVRRVDGVESGIVVCEHARPEKLCASTLREKSRNSGRAARTAKRDVPQDTVPVADVEFYERGAEGCENTRSISLNREKRKKEKKRTNETRLPLPSSRLVYPQPLKDVHV